MPLICIHVVCLQVHALFVVYASLLFVRVFFLLPKCTVVSCFCPLFFSFSFLSSCSFAIFSSPPVPCPVVFPPPSSSLVPLRHEREVHVTFCHRLVPSGLCGWLHQPKRLPRTIERDKGNWATEQLGNDRKPQGTHLLLWILVLVLVGVYRSVARRTRRLKNIKKMGSTK